MLADILARHRGPYQFCVSRPAKKKGHHVSEWLQGNAGKDDVGSEAMALLQDPRDTIEHVAIYSEADQCFIAIIRGAKDL